MTVSPSLLRTPAGLFTTLSTQSLRLLRAAITGHPHLQAHCHLAPGDPLPLDRVVRLVSWNIQFCAGRTHHFFYEGGEEVRISKRSAKQGQGHILQALKQLEPDLICLQEVDCCCDRTGRVDQRVPFQRAWPTFSWSSVAYMDVPWVPIPWANPLGKMNMHLLTMSRFPIRRAQALPLPRLNESWLRQQHNLHRQVLSSLIHTADADPLTLFNTHLSAFSKGDGTLPRQIHAIDRALHNAERDSQRWWLVGDLNALPPGDDPARLGVDAHLYPEAQSPLSPLFAEHRSAVPQPELVNHPDQWTTYRPYPADQADRTLDYGFHSARIRVHSVRVAREFADYSDHLPLVIDFALQS